MIRRALAAGALFASVALMSACGGSTPTSTTTDSAAAQPSVQPSVTPSEAAPVYKGDQPAEWDVTLLWQAVAIWYVDNDGAPPAITVEGGRYLLNGTDIGPVTPDVQFGGLTGTGPDDWCVWVTNPLGDQKDFQHAAAGSYEPGKCGS